MPRSHHGADHTIPEKDLSRCHLFQLREKGWIKAGQGTGRDAPSQPGRVVRVSLGRRCRGSNRNTGGTCPGPVGEKGPCPLTKHGPQAAGGPAPLEAGGKEAGHAGIKGKRGANQEKEVLMPWSTERVPGWVSLLFKSSKRK